MTSTEHRARLLRREPSPSAFTRLSEAIIRKRLSFLDVGSITIVLPDGTTLRHCGQRHGPHAELVIRQWRALWRLMTEGDIGLARSYIEQDCDSPCVKTLIAYGAANEQGLSKATPNSRLNRWIDRLRHWRRSNTRSGSRRNIASHYDLGNDFYAHWLDHGMNYSSAIYVDPGEPLEIAQQRKLDRIIQLMEAGPGQDVLEIGCGWGALAEQILSTDVASLTGLTLSVEQQDYAQQRLAQSDAAARHDIRLQDYRDVSGRFDRIVSIEMVEAVGAQYWPVYFGKLRELLADDGVVILQAITIDASRFDAYRRQPDFIQRFIFPGGMLPTAELLEHHAKNAGLQLISTDTFGNSYAYTLAEWRRRFLAAWPEVEVLGFDARFRRMWDYYLAYCEVGFETRAINVGLYRFRPTDVLSGEI